MIRSTLLRRLTHNNQTRLIAVLFALLSACATCAVAQAPKPLTEKAASLRIGPTTVGDEAMTMALARADTVIRRQWDIESEQTAIGVLDLKTARLAMLRPDTIYYAASVPKIAILLSYFHENPDAAENLDEQTRRELGLMIKQSSNEFAAKHSRALGMQTIADLLMSDRYRLYDPMHGGGLWMGKHYGPGPERMRDPLAGQSHAATVRQLLRYYLMLEQGRLVSPEASKTIRSIFESPAIDHLDSKIFHGLAERDVQVIRKSGTYQSWVADTAVVTGKDRHYILVVLTHVAGIERGEDQPLSEPGNTFIATLAGCVDDWAVRGFQGEVPLGDYE